MLIRSMKRVRVRSRRLSTKIAFTGFASSSLGPIRVVARYPGDVRETWPCDDVFTTGPDDGCTQRMTRPY